MGHSTDLTYRIEQEELHWVISFGGGHCGRFTSRAEAIRSALGDAERVRNLGHRVQVVVTDPDGTLHVLTGPHPCVSAPHSGRPPGA